MSGRTEGWAWASFNTKTSDTLYVFNSNNRKSCPAAQSLPIFNNHTENKSKGFAFIKEEPVGYG